MPIPAPAAITPSSLDALGPVRAESAGPARPASAGSGEVAFQALLERAGSPLQSGALQGAPSAVDASPPGRPGGDALRGFYEEAHRGSRALDGLIAEAQAGRTFSSQELIGLQARIYRSTMIVETFSKVVESTSAGARQLLGTNL